MPAAQGLGEDRLRGGSADASDAEHPYPQEIVERTHTASRLHPYPGTAVAAHEAEVFIGRTAVVVAAARLLHETVAGGGLHEGDVELGADLAEADDVGVLQIVVFEDDLQERAAGAADGIQLTELVGHIVPVAAEHLADVDDGIDLGRALGRGTLGLEDLQRDVAVAVRETGHRADTDARAGQRLHGQRYTTGLHASGGTAAAPRDGEPLVQLRIGERGMQQRVVDHPGEIEHGGQILALEHKWRRVRTAAAEYCRNQRSRERKGAGAPWITAPGRALRDQ